MKRFILNGSLDLSHFKHKNPLVENMTVKGNLNLCVSTIEVIPNGLIVEGNLDLYGTKITCLPDNLKVGGKIYKDF